VLASLDVARGAVLYSLSIRIRELGHNLEGYDAASVRTGVFDPRDRCIRDRPR
jgi:hypothetical protein